MLTVAPTERTRTGFLAGSLAFCCMSAVLAAPVHQARAEETATPRYEFDIEEETLGAALKKFADQTDFLVLYPFQLADVTGVKPVKGRFNIDEALETMLSDAGFSGGLTRSGVITIRRTPNDLASQEGHMNNKSLASRLAGGVSSLVIGATGLGGAAAQTQAAGASDEQDRIIVTGSRIANANLTSSSSVTVLGGEEIDARGVIRVEDLLNILPQALSGQSSTTGVNGAQATVNLRGLGANRTLVLMDGKRLPYGSPINAAADLNQIPSQLVERIEVLTGGATAVYGSDAVAGVVNFKMNRNFEGIEANFQGGFFQAGNSNSDVEAVLADFNQPDPDGIIDGRTLDMSIVAGTNVADGRGNITVYFGYSNDNPVRWEDRDITACPFGTRNDGADFSCSGSNAQPRLTRYVRTGADGFNLAADEATGLLRDYNGATDAFNFAFGNYLQRPRERFTYGAFAHYELAPDLEFFLDYSFADNTTDAQIAPGGLALGRTDTINCDNPLLSADQLAVFCDPSAVFVDDDGVERASLRIGRRNLDFPRNARFSLKTQRVVGGFRGALFDGFDYEVFGQFSNVDFSEVFTNDVSVSRVTRAIDVVTDPGTGQPVCRSVLTGEDPDCVPFDVFSPNGITEAASTYIATPSVRVGDTSQLVIGASLAGGLDRWGLTSPLAADGVQVAAGFEFRRDSLSLTPDTSDGRTSVRVPVDGAIEVYEFFGEMQAPLVQDRPFFDELSLTAAYRFSDFYETTGTQNTYSVGATWAPGPDLRLRGQYQRATRSPNPIELFNPQEFGLDTLTAGANGLLDPCAGDFNPATSTPEPARSFEECARTGVTADQYGSILDLSDNIVTLVGGNPDLDAEFSDTWTAGLIFTPSAVPGLVLSVDYFSINVDGFIGAINPNDALTQCLDTGASDFCSLINRDSEGTFFLVDGEAFIQGTNINTGRLNTSGFDLNATYAFDLDDLGLNNGGEIRLGYISTILSELQEQSLPGEEAIECAGFHAGACDNPAPKYRHRTTLGWVRGALDTTLSWRYLSSVDQFGASTTAVNQLDAVSYFDLSVQYEIKRGLELRGGVNNLFDQDPPLTSLAGFGGGEDAGRGNSYPQLYDAQGRFVFAGITARF